MLWGLRWWLHGQLTRQRFRPKPGWRQWRLKNWWRQFLRQRCDRNDGGRWENQQQTWYQLCLSLALVYKLNTWVDGSHWLIGVRETMDLVLGDEQRNRMREIMDFKEFSLLRKRRNQIGVGGWRKNERNLGISHVENQHLKLPFFFYFHWI